MIDIDLTKLLDRIEELVSHKSRNNNLEIGFPDYLEKELSFLLDKRDEMNGRIIENLMLFPRDKK